MRRIEIIMKKLLYLCLFPFLGISCMDDLGTYDYNPLHEITIDTLKNRTIEIYHQLEVEPKISFSFGILLVQVHEQ